MKRIVVEYPEGCESELSLLEKAQANEFGLRWLEMHNHSIDHYLFHVNFDFVLLSVPRIYSKGFSDLDFTEYLIKEFCLKNIRIKEMSGGICVPLIQRSFEATDIAELVVSGRIHKTTIPEVVSVYEDAARKQYCMIAPHTYFNYIDAFKGRDERYAAAEKELREMQDIDLDQKQFLLKEMQHLCVMNTINVRVHYSNIQLYDILNKRLVKTLNLKRKERTETLKPQIK